MSHWQKSCWAIEELLMWELITHERQVQELTGTTARLVPHPKEPHEELNKSPPVASDPPGPWWPGRARRWCRWVADGLQVSPGQSASAPSVHLQTGGVTVDIFSVLINITWAELTGLSGHLKTDRTYSVYAKIGPNPKQYKIVGKKL